MKSIFIATFLCGLTSLAQANAADDSFELSGTFEQVGACQCFDYAPTQVCSAPKFALNLLADSSSNRGRSSNGRGAEEVFASDGSKQTVGHWLYPYPGQSSSSVWDEFRKRDTDSILYRFSMPRMHELNVEVVNRTLSQPDLPIHLRFHPSRAGGQINQRERREFKHSATGLEYRTHRRQRAQPASDPATKNYSAFSENFSVVLLGPDRVKLVSTFDYTMDTFGYGPRFSFNYGYIACELKRR